MNISKKKYEIENSHLMIFDGVKIKVKLPYPVYKVEAFDDCLVVLLIGEDGYFPINENIFGVSYDGKILWQIEKVEHVNRDSPYTGMSKKDNLLLAYNWDGFDYQINPKTGKIINRKFVK